MSQSKNKTPTQVPTLGTLLATALGIAYGAWAQSQESRATNPNRNIHNQN